MKILVVEDDATNVHYLATILGQYGAVELAGDGNEAVRLFLKAHENNDPFQVIFMDIAIPAISGLETTMQIRDWERQNNNRKKAAIIFQTGKVLTDEVLAGFKCGADLYVPKPFKPDQIRGFMKECGYFKKA